MGRTSLLSISQSLEGRLATLFVVSALHGCSPAPRPQRQGLPESVGVETLSQELALLSGPVMRGREQAFYSILERALSSDLYACAPSARTVFFSGDEDGEKTIAGTMPHYGLFWGPMHYRIDHRRRGFRVTLQVSVEVPVGLESLELGDCGLRTFYAGPVECSGTPYPNAPGLSACPHSGSFRVHASREAIDAYLTLLSVEVERDYNRDALFFGLPIAYDFEFVRANNSIQTTALLPRADITLPLSPTCGRTPYFQALRTGWSLPVVAHEMGHVLGLLDEYEMLSGIVSFYPKTPFEGAEISRMAVSMKESTRFLPIHHYLILRRYFCPAPSTSDPYRNAIQ